MIFPNILNGLDRLDLEVLLCHILKVERSFLKAYPETKLSEAQIKVFSKLAARKLQHEPIAYITGNKYFFGLKFLVNKNVLIPRPETEMLVEQVFSKVTEHATATILELGTGSGAVALSIAKYRPNCVVYATDISNVALKTAKKNAKLLNINNVKFYCGDWFKALPKLNFQFDVIISNPPYISYEEIPLCDQEIFYEPKLALFTDNNGLYCLEKIIFSSVNYLTKNGYLLLEHGYTQAAQIVKMLKIVGLLNIQPLKDLSGLHRVVVAQKL